MVPPVPPSTPKIVGAKYKLVIGKTNYGLENGDVVTLVYDDGTDMPLFQHPKITLSTRGFEHSAYFYMWRFELISESREASSEPVRDIAKANNTGGNSGCCVACGITLSSWGGGMGWYCQTCEG